MAATHELTFNSNVMAPSDDINKDNMDANGDGTIDLNEYLANMKNRTDRHLIHRALVQRSTARKQFMKFDKDGSGYITMEEIKQVFEERTGGSVSIEEVQSVLKDADKNSDGKINYDEFLVMMTK